MTPEQAYQYYVQVFKSSHLPPSTAQPLDYATWYAQNYPAGALTPTQGQTGVVQGVIPPVVQNASFTTVGSTAKSTDLFVVAALFAVKYFLF